jgi:AraC family transcriptional regulator
MKHRRRNEGKTRRKTKRKTKCAVDNFRLLSSHPWVPDSYEPGKLLRGGEFYSPVHARLSTSEVVLCELRQPCSSSVPRHEHQLAYVTLVLGGDYVEGDRGLFDELRPFTAFFNPAGARHSTLIGPSGAFFFTIEFRPEALQALEMRLPDRTAFDRGAGSMLWPGLSLYSAFKAQTADPLVLEAHVVEMLAAIAGLCSTETQPSEKEFSEKQPSPRNAPRWFVRVKERLHEEFRDRLRMRDLARDAGVHPVHLARVFRRIERRTPGEYQQRLQVRAACELLRDPEWPLAAIAAECGFADQSHFTRVFHRMAGTTPARFRQALVSPAA